MRLFIAINLPPEQRRAIHEAAAALRASARSVAWVAPDRLHLTLKFLGERSAESVPALGEALGEVVARYRPISLELGGFGAFPNLRAPRVVWLGASHDAKLELLHHDVESACAELGYEVEGRAFRPHVTLGRVKHDLRGDEAGALADAVQAARFDDELEIRSVDLMSSVLSGQGPAYSVVAALPLRAA